MRPTERRRKAFGQHFLTSETTISLIIERFISEWSETPCTRVIEIGPGKGALTLPLIEELLNLSEETRPQLTVIEKDRILAEEWRKGPHEMPVGVIESDFNDLRPEQWAKDPDESYAVLSNLPYSASTAILGELTRATFPPSRTRLPLMLLMFQKEVADRIEAAVPSRESSALTVFTQNAWKIERVLNVPPSAFSPPPDVDSTVLAFQRRREPMVPESAVSPEAPALWERLVRSSFLHRRKMLRASLRGDQKLSAALASSGVDAQLRAEALTWKDWGAIMKQLLGCFVLISSLFLVSGSMENSAFANVADAFGLSSRSAALAGATDAWGADGKRILFSWQTLWMTPEFDSISGVDPRKHIINAGIGLQFPHLMGRELRSRLDVNAAYHQLVEQKVTKTSGEIGAPGYTVGGKIYGVGISLSLEL